MNKSRRDFLKKLPLAMSIPFTMGGFNVRAINQGLLGKMGALSTEDKVLVILQLHGGNDGLNCCIPIEGYEKYYSLRPNIAIPAKNSSRKYIPLDSTLASDAQIGLHPDMQAMKALYDQGRMTIVQGVSYENNNGSHFRGRDVWFMGGSADDQLHSGWLGRYLKSEYAPYTYPEDFLNPAIPENEMIDPLAIEIGNDVSLIFHQQESITTAFNLPMGVNGVTNLASLVANLEGFQDLEGVDPRGIPSELLAGSPYYKELDWILNLEDKTKDYSSTLLAEFNAGSLKPKATYPTRYPFNAPSGSIENSLSGQLQLVANLLAGGCKTKVFMVRLGGFDTHADQVEALNPTMGGHAALLYHISTAMKAFQEDLRAKGGELENRVLTITTSEFGRRAKSNGSYGTDHGTASPMFIFGKGVQPGVVGKALDLTDNESNLQMQYDYRNIYANIMKDWMGVTDIARLNEIFPDGTDADDNTKGLMTSGTSDGTTFEQLPIATQNITSNENFIGNRFSLEDCFPNPAKGKTTVHFKVNSAYHVDVVLFDNSGKKMMTMVEGIFEPGSHKVEVDLTGLPAGHYIYELKTGFYKEAKKLVIVK